MMEQKHTYDPSVQILRRSIRLFFLMVVGVCLLPLASAGQSAGRTMQAPDPQAALTAPALNAQQMEAFSQRSLEKISEWLVYMKLLRDAREDSMLYSIVMGMTEPLFINEEVKLIFRHKLLPLKEWLLANQTYGGTAVLVSRHEWIEDWKVSDRGFSRRIMVNLYVTEDEPPAWIGERIMTIHLTRVNKTFGEESVEAWEIRLGGLE